MKNFYDTDLNDIDKQLGFVLGEAENLEAGYDLNWLNNKTVPAVLIIISDNERIIKMISPHFGKSYLHQYKNDKGTWSPCSSPCHEQEANSKGLTIIESCPKYNSY